MTTKMIRNCIIAFSLLIIVSTSYCMTRTGSYSDIIKQIDSLNHSVYARSTQIGKSASGEPIYAIALTNPESLNSGKRLKALIMAGQHGDEKTAVKAMMSLATGLSNTSNRRYLSLLKDAVIMIIPVVNPDGFINNRRENGSGRDLNRDWGNFTQPETKTIEHFLKAFKPHLVVDLHEWTEWSPAKTNCIEAPGFGDEDNHKLARILAGECDITATRSRSGFNRVLYHQNRIGSLAHRYLSRTGTCSMLVETTPYWNQSIRFNAYQKLVMSMLNKMAFPDKSMIAYVDSLEESNQKLNKSIAALYNPSNPTSWRNHPIIAGLPFIALCCLLLGFTYTRYKRKDFQMPTWTELKRSYLGSLTIADTARLNAPTGKKLRIFREHRHRPTDRCRQKSIVNRETSPTSRRRQAVDSSPSKRICASYTIAHLR